MLLVLNIVQGMIMKIQFKCECNTKTQWGHGIGDNKKRIDRERIKRKNAHLATLSCLKQNDSQIKI